MVMMRENGRERASEGTLRGEGTTTCKCWAWSYFFLFFFCETSYAFSWHGVTAHGFVAFLSLSHPSHSLHHNPSHPIHLSNFCLLLPATPLFFFSFEILSIFSHSCLLFYIESSKPDSPLSGSNSSDKQQ